MSEDALWDTFRRHLGSFGRFVRIEDRLQSGVPDVAYCVRGCSGWIELKHRPDWPERSYTVFRLPKLKIEQVQFMEAWEKAGGAAWMLLQVERDYLLFDPAHVRQIFAGRCRSLDVRQLATVSGGPVFPGLKVLKALLKKETKFQ